jgi:hypothetical protein
MGMEMRLEMRQDMRQTLRLQQRLALRLQQKLQLKMSLKQVLKLVQKLLPQLNLHVSQRIEKHFTRVLRRNPYMRETMTRYIHYNPEPTAAELQREFPETVPIFNERKRRMRIAESDYLLNAL